MTIKGDYEQIDGFLHTIDTDLTEFVKTHLKRLILVSYRENLNEFLEGLNIVHNSIEKVRILIPLVRDKKNDFSKKHDLSEESYSDNGTTERDLEIELAEHGLTGYELKRKLRIFYRTRDLFLEKYSKTAVRIARGFARRFFDAMNVVLDSLASVLPPLGAVKEFKNSIEVVI